MGDHPGVILWHFGAQVEQLVASDVYSLFEQPLCRIAHIVSANIRVSSDTGGIWHSLLLWAYSDNIDDFMGYLVYDIVADCAVSKV